MVVSLTNQVRSYAWGSPSVLPDLLGRKPTGEPQAELWVGAHPGSPSTIAGDGRTLEAYIAANVDDMLGQDAVRRYGPRLPFLLKILAIEKPLSIQVHPTKSQAEVGFAAENAAGVPIDAPQRNYRDANHKPEMVVALTDFTALVGFRDPSLTAKLLRTFGAPELDETAAIIVRPGGLEAVVRAWLTLPDVDMTRLVGLISRAAEMRDIATHFPGDRGLLIAFLLNRVVLRPGEAVFVASGVPHAYVSGVAVEAQASSDNTLRAGLTPKHVDVEEVLRLLRYEPDGGVFVKAIAIAPGVDVYSIPDVDELLLSRIDSTAVDVTVGPGPALVLAVDGAATVLAGATASAEGTDSVGDGVHVGQGAAAFVSAADGQARVRTQGVAFVVGLGQLRQDRARL